MKKRIQALVMSIVLILSMSVSGIVFADNTVTVKLNGETLTFDVPPQIINGRTMVPMRAIFETFGYSVDWQEAQQKITAVGSEGTIIMKINNHYITKNSESVYTDVAPMIINGRTLVPLRAISELLNCNVDWNSSNKLVSITTKSTSAISIEDMTNIGNCFINNSNYRLEDNYGNFYSNYIDGGTRLNYSYQTLLNKNYSRFTCTIYVPKGTSWSSSAKFTIKADENVIYTSPVMKKTSSPVYVDVDISNCNNFEIFIEGGSSIALVGDGKFYKK